MRYEDVRTVGAGNLQPVDLICGGFPCQDVSSAGKGAGLAGARSGLWYEFARIVDELRPKWVVVENVASGATRWVDAVRGNLGELGYASLPVPIAASDLGAPHRRNRIFLVAHAFGGELRQQQGGGAAGRTGRDRPSLQMMAKRGLWPTPTVKGNYNKAGLSRKAVAGLATAVARWPTPTRSDARGGGAR